MNYLDAASAGLLLGILTSACGADSTAEPREAEPTAATVVAAMHRFYDDLESVALTFDSVCGSDIMIPAHGSVLYRRAGRFRVEFDSPLMALTVVSPDGAFERVPPDAREYSRVDPRRELYKFGLLVDPLEAIGHGAITLASSTSPLSERLRVRLDTTGSDSSWLDVSWSGAQRGQVVRAERPFRTGTCTVDVEADSFIRNPVALDDAFLFRPPTGAIDVTSERARGVPTPELERALDGAELVLDRAAAVP